MANIIDFGKKNLGNIVKVAGGAALLVAGVMGAIRGKNDDVDDYDEEYEEELDETRNPPEETAEDTEPEG